MNKDLDEIDILLMPFGKYEGEEIGELPADYLLWLYKQDWISKYPDIERWIKYNEEQLLSIAEYGVDYEDTF